MAWAHVTGQDASSFADASAGTIAVTFPGNLTAGNLVVLSFSHDGATEAVTISDGTSNVYTQVGSTLHDATNGQNLYMFYGQIVTGAVATITVTLPNSPGFRRLVASEYSGLDTSTPFVTSSQAVAGTATTAANNATTPTATPTVTGQLVVGAVCVVNQNETYTAGTSFLERIHDSSTTGAKCEQEDRSAPSTTALAATWTLSVGTTGGLACYVAIFKEAAAAAFQTVLPDADIATTGWSTAPLFSKVNDASDGTVITATLA